MRKKMLFLALALAATAASLVAPGAVSGSTTHACPRCTTYPDGSQCCVSCICDASGRILACTNNFCPPPGGA